MTNCIFRDFRFPFYVVFLPANSFIMLYIHQKVALLHMYTVSHSSVIQFEISLPVKKLTTKSSSKSVNTFLAHLTQIWHGVKMISTSRSTYPAILKYIWLPILELLPFFHQICKILILFILYFKNYKR
jgi:hypothetical protein